MIATDHTVSCELTVLFRWAGYLTEFPLRRTIKHERAPRTAGHGSVGTVAIVLDLMEPAVAYRRFFDEARQLRLDPFRRSIGSSH